MKFLKRNKERTPNHLAGALFGGFVGVIGGILAFAAMRHAGMSPDWQNDMAGGLVVGSAIGARFPILAQVSLEFFKVFFP